jgi:6-phosphogluconate dehydrogenase
MKKVVGYVGLGKMGGGMVARLIEQGWTVHAYDPEESARTKAANNGAQVYDSIAALIAALPTPRVLWFMIPAGKIFDETVFGTKRIPGVLSLLKKGDTIIDGGNSFFEDSVRRGALLKKKGVHFIDAGTSGGPAGARNGACIMVGGDEKSVKAVEQIFIDAAAPSSYLHAGKTGAGHFVKMVHNGIEYGMMQAIGEGFELIKKSPFKVKLTPLANLYNHGSVIESRLIGWLRKAYQEHGEDLKAISGTVGHTGEGMWTVHTAKKWKVPAPIIAGSMKFRKDSVKKPSYTGQVVSALRGQFGGHAVGNKKKPNSKH